MLVREQVDFPHRHDLDALRKLVPEGWQIAPELADLSRLTEWAVEARYPGDWSDASESDAQEAIAQARAVFGSVLARLATI